MKEQRSTERLRLAVRRMATSEVPLRDRLMNAFTTFNHFQVHEFPGPAREIYSELIARAFGDAGVSHLANASHEQLEQLGERLVDLFEAVVRAEESSR